MTERELWQAWEIEAPGILGAICDAISTALGNIDNVKVQNLPRMADPAKWIIAAEPDLPWENGTFLKEYNHNRERLVDMTLEADPVAPIVVEFFQKHGDWSGTPTELLNALDEIVPKTLRNRKIWPKRANTLSNKLRQAAPSLRKRGIEIERSKSGQRNITIRKVEDEAVRDDTSSPLAMDGKDDLGDKSCACDSIAITQGSYNPPLLLPKCCLSIELERDSLSIATSKVKNSDQVEQVLKKEPEYQALLTSGNEEIGENPPKLVKRGQGDYARVYRPWKIEEVYGQEEVKKIIKNGLDNKTLAQAILFHGESGIGKTTFARIIGAGMLCEHGPTSQPCFECQECRYVLKVSNMSYMEMNNANLTGVEAIRKIGDDYHSYPFFSNYKIFVYDECHRLSLKAQDLLLKIVEDSSLFSYSIFCSTEPDNIVETLRNRCMPFELKKIPDEDIKEMLNDVCKSEGFKPNPEVFDEIAKEADGRARNALIQLQKAVAAGKLGNG